MSRLLLPALCTPVLAAALYVSLRLSYADRLANRAGPGDLDAAIALAPDNTAYRLRRASPEDLRHAAGHSPGAAALIAMGLHAEAEGNPGAAERFLLEAAGRDTTYLPRWSLANFYFRQHRWEQFWHWSAAATRIYEGDLTGLYSLCLRAENGPEIALRRVVPQRAEAEAQFLRVALALEAFEQALAAAARLVSRGRPGDLQPLLSACSSLAPRRPDLAVELWNRLARARMLPHEPLDARAGLSLTNPSFREPPSQAIFNWQAPALDGVTVGRLEAAGGLRIRFSGAQPETGTILRQRMPVVPAGRYLLEYDYRRAADPEEASPRWRIAGQSSPPLGSGSPATGRFEFRTAPGEPLAVLELVLGREAGKRRPAGELGLVGLRLSMLGSI